MLILLPIYQNLKVVGRQTFCLDLPYCNRLETHLGTTYRVFTQDKFIKLFVGKNGNDFKFSWRNHNEAPETEVETNKASLLGMIWKHRGMGNVEAVETEMIVFRQQFEKVLTAMVHIEYSTIFENDPLLKIFDK